MHGWMSKRKAKWMDEKAVKRFESDIWVQCIILSASYLMDEFDYSEEKIIDYYEALTRYIGAIKSHLITIDKVKEIINEHTGLKM